MQAHNISTPPDLGEANPHGHIVAANESRFRSTHFSEPLTAYAVGWSDPENLDDLLEFIAPAVEVGRRFEFKKAENAEAFLSEADDVRAIGAAFKRVEFSGTTTDGSTQNKGLTIRVDHDDEVGPDWRERHTRFLLQRLVRNELRRAFALLDAAATSANKTWGDASTPDVDVREALRIGKNASGVRPNRALYGGAAWDKRASAYESKDDAAAYASAFRTPEELAGRLMLQGVRVSEAVYSTGGSAKADVVGSSVHVFHALSGAMKDEPSNIKRFSTPTEAGRFRVFLEEHDKFTDISVEHYSRVYVTNPLGIRKLTIS